MTTSPENFHDGPEGAIAPRRSQKCSMQEQFSMPAKTDVPPLFDFRSVGPAFPFELDGLGFGRQRQCKFRLAVGRGSGELAAMGLNYFVHDK